MTRRVSLTQQRSPFSRTMSLVAPAWRGAGGWTRGLSAGRACGETRSETNRVSETDPEASKVELSSSRELSKSLLFTAFQPPGALDERWPVAASPYPSRANGAKPCGVPSEASRPSRASVLSSVAGSLEPRRSGGATAGDDEESSIAGSQQAFSGRPASAVLGRVPTALNGPAPRQLGGVGPERLNQSSACRRWVQRHTGPRTPLREIEGRPRAKSDKKESSKCSQVEVDSC
jgi:hypothetical protein